MTGYPPGKTDRVHGSGPGSWGPGQDLPAGPLYEGSPFRSQEPLHRMTKLTERKAAKHRHNDRQEVKTTSKERPLFQNI